MPVLILVRCRRPGRIRLDWVRVRGGSLVIGAGLAAVLPALLTLPSLLTLLTLLSLVLAGLAGLAALVVAAALALRRELGP